MRIRMSVRIYTIENEKLMISNYGHDKKETPLIPLSEFLEDCVRGIYIICDDQNERIKEAKELVLNLRENYNTFPVEFKRLFQKELIIFFDKFNDASNKK